MNTPFQIHVPDDVLTDLRARLDRTLFTQPSDSASWAAGTDPAYLRELVRYWLDDFDWRAAETALNKLPQYLVEIRGQRVHLVHLRGRRAEGAPPPLPLVLSHGWPGSFVEMLRLAPLLTDPEDPADAFDVVIPSPPGFRLLRPAQRAGHWPGHGTGLARSDDRQPGLPPLWSVWR